MCLPFLCNVLRGVFFSSSGMLEELLVNPDTGARYPDHESAVAYSISSE